MSDDQRKHKYIARLIDDTNARKISWEWVEDTGEYYANDNDEAHLFFLVGHPKGTSFCFKQYDIYGVFIIEIDGIDCLQDLYNAVLGQNE